MPSVQDLGHAFEFFVVISCEGLLTFSVNVHCSSSIGNINTSIQFIFVSCANTTVASTLPYKL